MQSPSMAFSQRADGGRVVVSYRDLFFGQAERPTHTDPNRPGVPYQAVQILQSYDDRWYLPVYPGMWFGAFAFFCDEGSILILGALKRTATNYTQNLWRVSEDHVITDGPNDVDETLGWEVPRFSGTVISSQVDKMLQDAPDSSARDGRVEPFLVSAADDGSPQIEGGFNQLTIWRRNLLQPSKAVNSEDPTIRDTGKYARDALEVSTVTLMWRDQAARILRDAGAFAATEEIAWT